MTLITYCVEEQTGLEGKLFLCIPLLLFQKYIYFLKVCVKKALS